MSPIAHALAVAKARVSALGKLGQDTTEARADLARLRVLALRDLETIDDVQAVISAAVLEGNPELIADALEQLAIVR